MLSQHVLKAERQYLPLLLIHTKVLLRLLASVVSVALEQEKIPVFVDVDLVLHLVWSLGRLASDQEVLQQVRLASDQEVLQQVRLASDSKEQMAGLCCQALRLASPDANQALLPDATELDGLQSGGLYKMILKVCDC